MYWGLIDKSMVDINFLRSQDLKVHLGSNVCGKTHVNASHNYQYCSVDNRLALTMAAEQPRYVDMQHVCE